MTRIQLYETGHGRVVLAVDEQPVTGEIPVEVGLLMVETIVAVLEALSERTVCRGAEAQDDFRTRA